MYSSILVGLVALGLALVFGSEAAAYPLASRRLPMLLVWVVAGLAILMMIEDGMQWRRRVRQRAIAGGETAPGESTAPAPVVWSALLPFAAAITAYVVLVPVAGYLAATPVFLGGVLLVSRAVSRLTALTCAVAITAVMWAIFIWALRLPIPLLPAWA